MFDNELTLLRHTTLALSLWSTAWASSSVLHTFRDVPTGANPNATLAFDPAGNLWGTTLGGGNSDTQHCFNGPNGCGTVFELTPDSGGGWNYHLIYKFTGGPEDGAQPEGPLVFDQTGHVYGTTFRGGTYQNGIVFELTSAPDGSWTEQILYSFQSGPDGANPLAGLTFDASGNLYSTTNGGGTNSNGTIYKLSSNGHGGWTESILYSFLGGTDGLQPRATLVFDSTGTLYGTTSGGGADHAGTVFKLTPSGAVWIETVLHSLIRMRSQLQTGAILSSVSFSMRQGIYTEPHRLAEDKGIGASPTNCRLDLEEFGRSAIYIASPTTKPTGATCCHRWFWMQTETCMEPRLWAAQTPLVQYSSCGAGRTAVLQRSFSTISRAEPMDRSRWLV